MNAKQALIKYQKRVEPLLNDYFKSVKPRYKKVSPESLEAVEILEEYTLRRAKRLRAALMYYSYLMMGGKNKKAAMDASIFIEILHAYLLIHDDVMDQDVLRRGKPTAHKIYEGIHKERYGLQDPVHFGESMAINLGDVACHISLKLLVDSDFEAENKIRALSKLHGQITTVGLGQMLDVIGSVRNEIKEKDVFQTHEYKTATYTYETPIAVGAILAGASDRNVKTLSKYSIPAGIAFQIQDDILGMYGDEDKLGKANTSDLREGKHTLLIIKALEKASKKDGAAITRALGNSNLTDRMAERVREIIRKTGSLGYSKKTAKKFVYKAKDALEAMPDWDGEGREFLEGVADYMINREF
ncbi:MAG: polyprenyl synthetase family protein [Candidatus Dojkabacteria bacterium]